MGWTDDLIVGLAEHLATAGIALWDPIGPYPANSAEPVITRQQLPAAPDRAIAISPYVDSSGDSPSTADVLVAVQFRLRGTTDPATVTDPADDLRTLLHCAENVTVGAIRLAVIWRQSSAPLGCDETGRWLRSENYYIRASRRSPWQPD